MISRYANLVKRKKNIPTKSRKREDAQNFCEFIRKRCFQRRSACSSFEGEERNHSLLLFFPFLSFSFSFVSYTFTNTLEIYIFTNYFKVISNKEQLCRPKLFNDLLQKFFTTISMIIPNILAN